MNKLSAAKFDYEKRFYGPQISANNLTKLMVKLAPNRFEHSEKSFDFLSAGAFDPLGNAILLLGGSKKGDDQWYRKNFSKADKLYEEHLEALKLERKI